MAISEQDLLKRDVLKSHIDAVNQRKLDMGPPSPRGNDYTRPVDEHVARGYFDEANEITPLGEEFLTLHDNGLVDNFGMATELGQSYLMSNREAQDAPVNVYRFREESGLAEAERFAASQDGDQRGFSDMIYDFATKSIPSAVETGYNIAIAPVAETALSVPRKIAELATGVDYKLPRTMSPNDITNAVAENMTGSILASEDIAAGAVYAGTMAMDDPATFGANILDKLPYGLVVRKVAGDPVMDEMVRRKTDESFAAKQAFERSRSEIAELTGAQMMETVAPIFQWAKAREQLVAQNGEEAVKSKEEDDRLLGSIALDPENVLSLGAGIAIKGATTAVAKTNLWAARTSLKNAALQAERAAVQSEMSAIQAGLTRPAQWISDAEMKSKALVDVGDFQGATRYDEFIKRVNLKSEIPLQRISELSATEAKLGDEITQLGSSPDIANAILASKEKAASFRNLTAGGFGLTGVVGDKIGSAMIKADDFLDAASKNMGIDSAVSALKSLPAAIGGYVMGGVPAGVTAALNVLARGKVVQSMGNFSKVLGSELMQERGSIGYWGRVAQNSTLTKAQRFLAHRADELTLGGSLMDVARPVVAGTVAAYPMNLAFEAISNPDASGQEILTNAMGPALVFGGGSAGAGAVLEGRQAHLSKIRMADEYNFTRRMAEQSTEGSQAFSSLVPSAKRMVSTLAATYPNLNWTFLNNTESYYDPTSNTINVNPESNNPLRPLISHEVLHYVTIRNQMEPVVHSALLGDSETPGLIRNTDGTLDPEFKAFKDVYDARIANANLPPRTIEQVAEEYFNEATVDELLSMVDTGEVSRIAGRTQLGRKVKALINATIPKITILKDLFTHTGGVREMNGKPVMGNGLLAEGIRDLPEAKAIMRKLIRDSAGQDPTRATSGDRSGTRIEIKRGDSVIDSFHSIFEVDANNKPIRDKNGDPVPLSRATDEARKSAGLVIGEAQRNRVSNGYLPKEGEMKQQANGSWQGRYIDKSLIDVLAGRGILNPKQIAILRNLSTATKGNQGLRFLLTNHSATIRNRKGKLNYATLEATLRESVPVGFSITKDGNILVHNMSVGQLDANITARAGSKRGMDLYSGNTESIKRDVSEMMELHQKNTATDEFYQNKHGSRWKEYQQFINTVFGLMTKEQQSINPMFQSDSISSQKGQVYRTYRLDRISKATRMDGATSMPFHYENIKMNFLPDGFTDATKPVDVTKIEDGFYSQLESVISKKIPTRATPEQIMATIDPTRGSGIKADEIKWSGIEQALPKLAVDGKVTKEALLKYLADEGNVRFEEVELTSPDQYNQQRARLGEMMGRGEITAKEFGRRTQELEMTQRESKFSQYVLPGGENYREVVLAIGKKSDVERYAEMESIRKELENPKLTEEQKNVLRVNYKNLSDVSTGYEGYTSSHFPDIPNYVAHMRLDERTLGDGKRTLHSAEYQSDRHQEGRKRGYTNTEADAKRLADLKVQIEEAGKLFRAASKAQMLAEEESFNAKEKATAPVLLKYGAESFRDIITNEEGKLEYYAARDASEEYTTAKAKELELGKVSLGFAKNLSDLQREAADIQYPDSYSGSVADAPFRTTWPLQLFKRQLRDAVEGGFDSVSWDVGDTQNDRFDLSKSVDKISVPMVNAESRSVRIDEKGGSSFKMMVSNDGTVEGQMSASQFTGKKLDEVIGKDMADKIMAAKAPVDFKGNDLKVGGSGMRGFYDTMLPKEIGKYVKQWGGKVEKSEIKGNAADIDTRAENIFTEWERTGDDYNKTYADAQEQAYAELGKNGVVEPTPIWRVDITPEMRKISETGQTRFLPEAVDAEYMKVVKSGDVKMQQKMVDEAAKVVGLVKVIRSFPKEAKTYQPKKGTWVSLDNEKGRQYQEDYAGANWEDKSAAYFTKSSNMEDMQTGWANGQTLKIKNPSQVKSADPITRDDSGKVIPLSQRFNPASSDIRYLPEGGSKAQEFEKTYGKIKRIPEVEAAAKKLKEGSINADEYSIIVNKYMPLKPFGRVLEPASKRDILRGLGERKAGLRLKKDLFVEPEEISAGQRLESRLDIPSYENEGVYVNALHEPRKNVNKGGAGKAVAYTATTVMDNVDFGVYENAALNIAAGSSKGTIATMQGDYVPMTTKQAYDLANGAIKNPEWTEIGMNPIRHSYFYDKATQTPIKTAEQVVQIGALVLAKNVVKGDRSEYRFLPEGDKKVKIAVNINDSGQKFTDQILNGEKTIETRPSINNALQSYLGQRVGIARTGVKNPQTGKADTKIVGYATIGKSPIHYTSEEAFRKDESKHLVKAGSKFDIKPNSEKFGYELTDIVRVNPFSPQSTNIKYSVIARDGMATNKPKTSSNSPTSKNKTLAGQIRKMKE